MLQKLIKQNSPKGNNALFNESDELQELFVVAADGQLEVNFDALELVTSRSFIKYMKVQLSMPVLTKELLAVVVTDTYCTVYTKDVIGALGMYLFDRTNSKTFVNSGDGFEEMKLNYRERELKNV